MELNLHIQVQFSFYLKKIVFGLHTVLLIYFILILHLFFIVHAQNNKKPLICLKVGFQKFSSHNDRKSRSSMKTSYVQSNFGVSTLKGAALAVSQKPNVIERLSSSNDLTH